MSDEDDKKEGNILAGPFTIQELYADHRGKSGRKGNRKKNTVRILTNV